MAEMTRKAVLESVANKLEFGNRRQLQNKLAHSNLYAGAKQAPNPKWFGNIAKYVYDAGEKSGHESAMQTIKSAIRVIVEFYPIDPSLAVKKKLLDADQRSGSANKYHDDLRHELEKATNGIYVFFDSMGRAIYLGKTSDQNLWKRMSQSFKGRVEGKEVVKNLYLVQHPKRNQAYKQKQQRDIRPQSRKMHDVACYFSAYAVHKDLVDAVESLLIHTSANDLQNTKMGVI
ncbi:MAG: hypothetical protein MPK31_01675 [Gammaproteobacteria bacterium]|nr:hypothetical protein [Gammaproteobacteria bacterium]